MAIAHVGSLADGTANRTSTTSITLNFATQVGDLILVAMTNGGADADPATPAGTIVTTGGVSFQKLTSLGGGASTDLNGSVWYGYATGNHNGQTITGSGFTNSAADVVTVLRGTDPSAPFGTPGTALNASGTNSLAALDAGGVAGCWLFLSLHCDDNVASASEAATDPATVTERAEHLSSGGNDTAATSCAAAMTGTGSTGAITWTNTRGAGLYQIAIGVIVKPPPPVVALEGRADEADAARAPVLARVRPLLARADEADDARGSILRAADLAGRADEADAARGDLAITTIVGLDGTAATADAMTLVLPGGEITLDAQGGNTVAGTNGPVSFSHTIGDGGNRMLVVGTGQECAPGTTPVISSVTYDGITMHVAADSGVANFGGTESRGYLFYLLDDELPAAGTYTVSITWASTPSPTRCWGASTSVTGIEQAVPDGVDAHVDGAAVSVMRTTIDAVGSDGWVFDVLGATNNAGTLAADADQVNVLLTVVNNASVFGISTKPEGAVSTTLGWTANATGTMAHALAEWVGGGEESFGVVRAVSGRSGTADAARGDLTVSGVAVVELDGHAASSSGMTVARVPV